MSDGGMAPSAPAAAPAPAAPPPSAPAMPAATPFTGGAHGYPARNPSGPQQGPPIADKVPVDQPQAPPQAQARPTTPTQPKAPQQDPQRTATGSGTTPRLERLKTADGQEVEVDVSELLTKHDARRHKVKVDGTDREVTLEDMRNGYQTYAAATKRFEEAKAMRAEMGTLREQINERIIAPLRDRQGAIDLLARPELMGSKQAVLEWMEDTLAAQYGREAMPPEQRKLVEEHERQTGSLRAERQRIEQERAEIQRARQEHEARVVEEGAARMRQHYEQAVPVLLRSVADELHAEGGGQGPAGDVPPEMMRAWADAKRESLRLGIDEDDRAIARRVMREHLERTPPQVAREAERRNREAIQRVKQQPGRGAPVGAKAPEMPKEIRTHGQLRDFWKQQDQAAQERWMRNR